ncbi:hypothetical protein HID58_094056 [Brassica napus]|nr:hypothetical protein HID58_094056 [Brassica napus]
MSFECCSFSDLHYQGDQTLSITTTLPPALFLASSYKLIDKVSTSFTCLWNTCSSKVSVIVEHLYYKSCSSKVSTKMMNNEDLLNSEKDENGQERAYCKKCPKNYVWLPTSGTSNLKRHAEKCSNCLDVRKERKFDDKVSREKFSRVIIRHNLPFLSVEYEELRDYLSNVQALLCTRSWIYGYNMLDDEDDNGEGETVVIRPSPNDVEDMITRPPKE